MMSEQEESAGRSIGLMLVVGAAAVVLLLVVGLGAFGLVGTTTVTVEESAQKDIEALVAQSQKRSAVFDIVTNPTNVTVKVKKMQ
jgi:hypothetical protein